MKVTVCCDLCLPDEDWTVYDGGSDLVAVFAEHILEMQRVCLYTLSPDYLRDAASYSHRVTLIKTAGKLVAFAFMNAETFMLPDAVALWDGSERLTQNAACFEASTLRKDLRRKDLLGVSIAHLGAIACSPFATKGLGSRLLKLQRSIAKSFGFASDMLAIEAIKPLDVDYYASQGFKTTTATFYPTDGVSLVPMFTKLLVQPVIELHMAVPKAITTLERNSSHATLWPDDDPRQADFGDGYAILKHVCTFLWQAKDTAVASEALRQITVRAKLTRVEATKLWSMRYHSLSYQKPVPLDRVPVQSEDAWFKGPKVIVSREVAKAIKVAYDGL